MPNHRHTTWSGSLLLVLGGALFLLGVIVQPVSASVTLVYVTATRQGSTVQIRWETATEINTAGFYVQRRNEATGEFERINPQLIYAEGSGVVGSIYQYTDETPGKNSIYMLEDITFSNESQFHGPFSPDDPTEQPDGNNNGTPAPTTSNTVQPTATNAPQPTATNLPTNTPIPTATELPSPTITDTPTNTPEPTTEPTSAPTNTPTATNTPAPTATATTAPSTPSPTDVASANQTNNTSDTSTVAETSAASDSDSAATSATSPTASSSTPITNDLVLPTSVLVDSTVVATTNEVPTVQTLTPTPTLATSAQNTTPTAVAAYPAVSAASQSSPDPLNRTAATVAPAAPLTAENAQGITQPSADFPSNLADSAQQPVEQNQHAEASGWRALGWVVVVGFLMSGAFWLLKNLDQRRHGI